MSSHQLQAEEKILALQPSFFYVGGRTLKRDRIGLACLHCRQCGFDTWPQREQRAASQVLWKSLPQQPATMKIMKTRSLVSFSYILLRCLFCTSTSACEQIWSVLVSRCSLLPLLLQTLVKCCCACVYSTMQEVLMLFNKTCCFFLNGLHLQTMAVAPFGGPH